MREIYYPSCGKGNIRACCWEPLGDIQGVVQIIHGIVEHVERYDRFASYLNSLGYVVVAEDHMGHGKSGGKGCVRGYFYGGWFSAVTDTLRLMEITREQYPNVPYIIFGHSMGSFMARTILIRYPALTLSGAVICGTGWIPGAVLQAGYGLAKIFCRGGKDTKESEKLHNLMFGAYNKKIEHPRTPFDWLNRDRSQVDLYVADPLCGFPETAGLARDMLEGLIYIQSSQNLRRMNKDLPVYFIAGGDDPVGDYGSGVRKTVQMFSKAGMQSVDCKIYPLCRHEILNEINWDEVYQGIGNWLNKIK